MRPLKFRAVFLLIVLFAIFGMASSAWAEVDGFIVWQPNPGGVSYVLPKVKGVDMSQFTATYLQKMKASDVYGKMAGAQTVNLSTSKGTFSELPVGTTEHPNVAVVLNRPYQMASGNTYLPHVTQSFEQEGPRLFSIPVGLENALSPQDMEQFRKQLNSFDGQLGIGGDDPHPNTYGQKSTKRTQGDISNARDLEQTEYLKEYLAHGKGRVFYICGSMQRAAIADGHGFRDEIAPYTQGVHRSADGPAMVEVVVEPRSEVAYAAGKTQFLTSNVHHAAVDPDQAQAGMQPTSKITAYNIEPDGSRGTIVKSIDFADNAGFATQFHPEFRGSPEENRIVAYVATGWKMQGRYPAEEVASCLERHLRARLHAVIK